MNLIESSLILIKVDFIKHIMDLNLSIPTIIVTSIVNCQIDFPLVHIQIATINFKLRNPTITTTHDFDYNNCQKINPKILLNLSNISLTRFVKNMFYMKYNSLKL